MLVIGLTGGIGSGKSTVANFFSKKNITIIDTDHLTRVLTQPNKPAYKKIIKKFGNDILSPDQTIDRRKLRKLIFNEQAHRLWLEKLLHPLIRTEVKRQITSSKSPYCIVVIPLLFETKPNPWINRILVVDAAESLQVDRTKVRDNMPTADIQTILRTQVNRDRRLSGADDIIYNDGKIEDLIPQIEKYHQLYLSLASNDSP